MKVGDIAVIHDSTSGKFIEKKEIIIKVNKVAFFTEGGYVFCKHTNMGMNRGKNFLLPYVKEVKEK